MLSDDQLNTITTVLLHHADLHTCFVFGSRVYGIPATSSDIDIAVAAERPLNPEERADLQVEFETALGIPVDLRDLRTLQGLILAEILQKGFLVLNKNPNYLDTRLREMFDYCQDMAPIITDGMKTNLEQWVNGK